MTIFEILLSAFKALTINKTRTFLTMLGVIIGVFAVVSLVSLVKGVENFITDRFNSLGSNLLFVSPGRATFTGDPSVSFSNNKLLKKHVELLNDELSQYLTAVAPSIRTGKIVSYKDKKYYATIIGSNQFANQLINLSIDKGKFFNKNDVDSNSRVAILGPSIAKEFFGTLNPIGQRLKINESYFTIIGTYKSKGGRQDERVVIPYTSMQKALDIKNFSNIVTKAKDNQDVELIIKKIEFTLLKDLDKEDFTIFSQANILESLKNILNILSYGLAAIAGISLIVGGIGIMNIMLVSVNERIQEIGLRKALGATSKDIGLQFLFEAIFISLVGGAIGLFLGYLTTIVTKQTLNAQIPWWSVFLAIGFSLFVGITFGTYPALKAAKKYPIVALRFE